MSTDRLLHRLLGGAPDETGARRTQRPVPASPTRSASRGAKPGFPFSIFKSR